MKTFDEFYKVHKTKLLPFALTVILSRTLYSIYQVPLFSLWTVGIILVSAVMFLFCDFINRHNFAGGVMLAVLIMFDLSAFLRLIMGHDYGESFQAWFLTGAEQAGTSDEYLIAFLISFVPFFAVVTYYFTVVLYRMSFLTLICLIPCAVSVKVLTDINNVYISLIAIVSVAVLMQNIRSEKEHTMIKRGMSAAVFSGGIFIFILLIISAAIPKESEARYYDRFEELFMNTQANKQQIENFALMSEFSGGASSFRNFSNVRMYTLYGDYPPYFKRQTFDYYDFENHRWYPDEYYSSIYYTAEEWTERAGDLSLRVLQQAIKKAEEYSPGFTGKYGLSSIAGYSQLNDPEKQMYVQPEDFGAVYYLSPARGINAEPFDKRNTESIYVTPGGVFRNRQRPHNRTAAYMVSYFDEYASRFHWMELGGANFDDANSLYMLNEMYGILLENADPLSKNVSGFIDVHADAVKYKALCESNTAAISDSISSLAHEITAGLAYDWEKAQALERYFINNDFVYDLETVAPDDSIEYFLFTSKRGSCSDFATAYVLLARSIGLTVRYAEGYSPDITSREGVYVIKDSCSHAYPEVYIQNMGWIVFEPTVPSNYNAFVADDAGDFQFRIDYDLVTVLCVIAVITLIVAVIVLISAPIVSEKMFISKISKAEPNDCAIMVYKRISMKTASKIISRSSCLTPYEFAEKFESITGCDISPLAYISEEISYGGKQAGEAEKQTVCGCYVTAAEKTKQYLKETNKQNRKAAAEHGKRK